MATNYVKLENDEENQIEGQVTDEKKQLSVVNLHESKIDELKNNKSIKHYKLIRKKQYERELMVFFARNSMISLINFAIFMSVNLFPYDTNTTYHRQNKLACNLYLGGEYLVDVLYVYIKLHSELNIYKRRRYNKCITSIMIYSCLMIGYVVYINIINFNNMSRNDALLFCSIWFRYFIYIVQLL
jgi:hypothetical protein